MITAKDITKKYLGIPYVHQGRTIQGLDCWGFIKCVYKDLGYELLDIKDYIEDWSYKGGNYIFENYSKQWRKVYAPRLFDIVMFKNSKNVINHIGIYLDYGKIIHCCKQGVVIAFLYRPPWNKRIAGFFRLQNDNNKNHT